MKLLITGSKGQLGSELRSLCHPHENGDPRFRGDDDVVFVDREELDITNAKGVAAFFEEHKPDYCINAAAYTNVEKAEDEMDAARAVNVTGAENIARACARSGAILFHISTDFVFDGKKSIPYKEDDEPSPLGVYGATKCAGDLSVQALCPKSFIVRTSWLYSSYGSNFVKTIMRLCAERDLLPVVADQYGSPTYARDLAEALLRMIDVCESRCHPERIRQLADRNDELYGIYHYANDGEVTWFEFAQRICELAGLTCSLQPIPTSDYPTKAQRPAYSVLSTKKITQTFGIVPPDWTESLEECITILNGKEV